jgi:hypothetical protein
MFNIEVSKLHWIDGSADCPGDLCLHGDIRATIGEECFEYSPAAVSATALYLLKTLTEDHVPGEDNQKMIPHCGHFIVPDEMNDTVCIIGCCNGIDWSVIHKGDLIQLITTNGKETVIHLTDYTKAVYAFADTIESYYSSCATKIPEDDFDRNAYAVFWKEWCRRRYGR